MKKIILISVLLLFFGIIPHVFAAGFTALAPIPGLTDPTTVGSAIGPNTLAIFFNNLYKYMIGLAAILAVIEIIWGGLEIATKDSVSKQSEGRKRITQAIFGLILVLSPVIVFTIINPSILNLSLNLPPLNTASATSTPSAAGNQTPATNSSGKTLNTLVYNYNKSSFLGFTSQTSSNTIIPRDAQAVSTFTSGCAADGGKVTTVIMANNVACPSDANLPNYDANTYSGVFCQNDTLTCN
jgi:hypothetical protein